MIKSSAIRICLLILISVSTSDLNAQISGYGKIRWEKEKVAPGLIWKSAHTLFNDSIPQNLNMLIINTNKRVISLSYDPLENIVLSKQAEKANALAAVNAGFFNIKDGGSVTYIRSQGVIAEKDTARKWSRNENMTGSVLVDKSNIVYIDKSYPNSWYDMHPEYPEVLVSGPLLIKNKEKAKLPLTPLVLKRHPRTAIGKRGNHRVIILTLDGRTDQALGMTLAELTHFMSYLKCKDAVNLDGGGSTTMWISGKGENGVVNMPSDNKKFDHKGERAVSDILIIR